MWSLRYIEDTTEPPDRGLVLGWHHDEQGAHLAFEFVRWKMDGVYVLSPDGVIAHQDSWTRTIFRNQLQVIDGGAA